MHLIPDADDLALARVIYGMFSVRDHARHIASEYALAHLSALLKIVRPRRTLEIGAGIGTMTLALLDAPENEIVAHEPVDVFRDEFRKNIGHDPRVALVHQLRDVDGPFDLVVLDGGHSQRLFRLIDPGTWIFVEGKRTVQRSIMVDRLMWRNMVLPMTEYRPPFQKKGCWIGRAKAAESVAA
jgi:protein-L-isoaspartate O-methyltransferase